MDAPRGFLCDRFKSEHTTFQDLNSKVGIIITGLDRVGRRGTIPGLDPGKSPFRKG